MRCEGMVIYRSGWCKLVRQNAIPRGVRYFRVGEVVELRLGGQWVPVRLACGGYRGWYYVMPDGHRGRLAVCMRVR
jgi:hypothetical protein